MVSDNDNHDEVYYAGKNNFQNKNDHQRQKRDVFENP